MNHYTSTFNGFVTRFGLDPDQFEPTPLEPIVDDDHFVLKRFIYHLNQRSEPRECPFCHDADGSVIKGHYETQRELQTSEFESDLLVIRMVRFKCKSCGKSYTVSLKGIAPYARIPDEVRRDILLSCCRLLSFAQIARSHGVTPACVIKIFDDKFGWLNPLPLPKILCIDEIAMKTSDQSKYVCVLYDWDAKEPVDAIESRQMPYLRRHFSAMNPKDREKVKIIVTDMYEGYAAVKREFFPKAMHVIDLFHVVKLLSSAVTRIRTNLMNSLPKGNAEKAFMKAHWRLFLCKSSRIPAKEYRPKGESYGVSYEDMVLRCCQLSQQLWDGYAALQELMTYNRYPTFTEAAAFVDRMAKKLLDSSSPLLVTVGRTYRHWRSEIANGMAKNQTYGRRFSNSVAEGVNNKLKSLVKISCGLKNFERFKKRMLLIFAYFKEHGTIMIK